jgi:hypothetical protein
MAILSSIIWSVVLKNHTKPHQTTQNHTNYIIDYTVGSTQKPRKMVKIHKMGQKASLAAIFE